MRGEKRDLQRDKTEVKIEEKLSGGKEEGGLGCDLSGLERVSINAKQVQAQDFKQWPERGSLNCSHVFNLESGDTNFLDGNGLGRIQACEKVISDQYNKVS